MLLRLAGVKDVIRQAIKTHALTPSFHNGRELDLNSAASNSLATVLG